MVRKVAHQRGANVDAQSGVAFRVVLNNPTHVGSKAGKAACSGLTLYGCGVFVIDEAGANLGKNPELIGAHTHANAEQALHHWLRALLSRNKIKGAVEADASREIINKVGA